ncbi:MAG: hypothetical protein HY820_41185, partial [Acidobacteria bacterium]|nr:hypothetical protein [Acidobacteriota bacterium]
MPYIHRNTDKPRTPRKAQTTPAPVPITFDSPADLAAALQLSPDPIQSDLLTDPALRIIINCCRQWGKSTVTAVKAIHQALTNPNSLSLVLSPSARQSGEFLNKVRGFLPQLGIPIRGDGTNEISALFPNRSRIVGLPGKEDTIRGFSGVSLLIFDEAARVEDELYQA